MNSTDQEPQEHPLVTVARRLWYGSYQGMLSTHSTNPTGYPFGSVVPFCRDDKGSPLLLLSHLAQHTKNLLIDPRCSLMLIEKGTGDIQQLTRLTCLARIIVIKEPPEELRLRYYRYFPDSREYHEKLNFNFYGLIPEKYYIVGGFGAVRWFEPSRLLAGSTLSFDEEHDQLKRIHNHPQFAKADTDHIWLAGMDPFGIDVRTNGELERINIALSDATPELIIEHIFQRNEQ